MVRGGEGRPRQTGRQMSQMDELIQQARRIVQNMDPQTKQALRAAVGQKARPDTVNKAMIQRALQGVDPTTRRQLERQVGARLDPRVVNSLDPVTLAKVMKQLNPNP